MKCLEAFKTQIAPLFCSLGIADLSCLAAVNVFIMGMAPAICS